MFYIQKYTNYEIWSDSFSWKNGRFLQVRVKKFSRVQKSKKKSVQEKAEARNVVELEILHRNDI